MAIHLTEGAARHVQKILRQFINPNLKETCGCGESFNV